MILHLSLPAPFPEGAVIHRTQPVQRPRPAPDLQPRDSSSDDLRVDEQMDDQHAEANHSEEQEFVHEALYSPRRSASLRVSLRQRCSAGMQGILSAGIGPNVSRAPRLHFFEEHRKAATVSHLRRQPARSASRSSANLLPASSFLYPHAALTPNAPHEVRMPTDHAFTLQLATLLLGGVTTMFTAFLAYLVQRAKTQQQQTATAAAAEVGKVRDSLAATKDDTASKMDKLAIVAKATHALVNSERAKLLLALSLLSRRVADLTGKPEDFESERLATENYESYLASQRIVDAQPGTDAEKRGDTT